MTDATTPNQDTQNSEPVVETAPEVITDTAVKTNLEFVPEETTPSEPIASPVTEPVIETLPVIEPAPVVIPPSSPIPPELKNEPVISTEFSTDTAHTTPKILEQAQPQTELEAAGFIKPSSGFMAWLRSKARAVKEFRKRQKLDKIMKLFDKKTEITNDTVEKLLHVSDSTATNYLKILVSEKKIKRSADNGRVTTYLKI
ncbi:MAG: hypothetical protein WCW56_03565 [Candidatus Paceibacterota bacterium]|jgi:hypothetical protein